jgi:hypothetical protein
LISPLKKFESFIFLNFFFNIEADGNIFKNFANMSPLTTLKTGMECAINVYKGGKYQTQSD